MLEKYLKSLISNRKIEKETGGKSWVITIPKTVKWEDYQKELEAVEDGNSVLNYHVRYFPKKISLYDRLYVVWNGKVRGWMEIVGLFEFLTDWECQTSGKLWPAGKYIQRSGKFHPVDEEIVMKGFRGIRKFVLERSK